VEEQSETSPAVKLPAKNLQFDELSQNLPESVFLLLTTLNLQGSFRHMEGLRIVPATLFAFYWLVVIQHAATSKCVFILASVSMKRKYGSMTFRVERSQYDPQEGFLYYVAFKPNLEIEADEVHARMPVEAAVSVSETGDLADLTFVLPKTCRNDQALTFIKKEQMAGYAENRVFIAIPGYNGDAVVQAPAKLDLDLAGRIVGMEIQWSPEDLKARA
jgi:hypothetical protein